MRLRGNAICMAKYVGAIAPLTARPLIILRRTTRYFAGR
ncbi:hypothetical protein JOE25_004099 [Serratia sp. PL17]|nr:hypothetical protein [Serratia sp. PL17]